MFRNRAIAKEPSAELDRPFRLVTTPARLALTVGLLGAIAGLLWLFAGQLAVKVSATGIIVNPPGNVEVYSLASGTVGVELLDAGEIVLAGQKVGSVVTPEGDEFAVLSPIDGTVVSLSTMEFALIGQGEPLMTIAPNSSPMIGIVFVPVGAMSGMVPGLQVEISPTTTDITQAGFISGVVSKIDPLPVTQERLRLIVGDSGIEEALLAMGPVQELYIALDEDPAAPLGLSWSGAGPTFTDDVTSGTIVNAKIVLRNQTPWDAFTGN